MILLRRKLIEGLEMSDILDNKDFTTVADAAEVIVIHSEKLTRDQLTEALSHLSDVKGRVLGILLMQVMGANVNSNLERIGPDHRGFWVDVAEVMGPDWLHMLKHIAAFMCKVDEF